MWTSKSLTPPSNKQLMADPAIVDFDADARFRALLQHVMPQTYDWENRYVDHEMSRIRHVFQPGLCQIEGRRVLEFGCNIGATSIVLAHLGGRTTACDINDQFLTLAKLNARRYGSLPLIRFVRLQEGAQLPFSDASFDVVTCNSVLEYVRAEHLAPLQRELDRVLHPGGEIVVFGTSNRLWPIEAHSHRWWVNYVPDAFDRMLGDAVQRGVWPWQIRHGFGRYVDVLGMAGAREYLNARNAARSSPFQRAALKILAHAASGVRISPGLLTPYMFAVLRKPSAQAT